MKLKRSFSNNVIDSVKFLKMTPEARLLYFDLGMKANDNGYVDAYRVIKVTDSSIGYLQELIEKCFVKQVGDWNELKIIHWIENNGTDNKRRGGKRFFGNRGYVLDRDGNKCAVCGSTQSLVVHHIDGYSENNPRNNKANKLITLCGKCHYFAHHIKSFIPAEILEEIGYFD